MDHAPISTSSLSTGLGNPIGSFGHLTEPARTIPVVAEPDVLVIGAGPAGIGAAVAAARNGAKTLLVERYGFLGGNLTAAMVNPMFTFHDIHGEQVIRGVAGELVERLVKATASPGHVTDMTWDNASMTPFDPEGMKLVLFDLAEDAGVQVLLHSTFADAVAVDGRVQYVVVENKGGRMAIKPRFVIDCSADADVVARVGAPFVKGRESDGAMQPATLFYRIGGVDVPALKQWMKANRHLLKDAPSDAEIDAQDRLAVLGLTDLVKQAMAAGDYPTDGAPRVLMYQLPQDGQFAVNCTRLQGIDGTKVEDLTRAEIATRRQAREIHRFLQAHVGGFAPSFILDTGVQVGIRETRRIVGDYTMVESDVLSSRAFDDGIACGTFAIDIHPPDGQKQIFTGSGRAVYEIPYRSLLPQGLDNLLVAGRCISASHHAFGSVRVMATAMGIGQGAGTAAALAVRQEVTSRQVDVAEVRRRLLEQGQYLLNAPVASQVDAGLRLERAHGSGAVASHHNPFAKKA